jgi:hypothetical protein
MKVTNRQLKQIIREEIQKELQLNESASDVIAKHVANAKDSSNASYKINTIWLALFDMADMLDKINVEQSGAPEVPVVDKDRTISKYIPDD